MPSVFLHETMAGDVAGVRDGLSSQTPSEVTVTGGCSGARRSKSNIASARKQSGLRRPRGEDNSAPGRASSNGRVSRFMRTGEHDRLQDLLVFINLLGTCGMVILYALRISMMDTANETMDNARATRLKLASASRVQVAAVLTATVEHAPDDGVPPAHEVELPFLRGESAVPTATVTQSSAESYVDEGGRGEEAVPIVHAVEVGALRRAAGLRRVAVMDAMRSATAAGSGARGGERRR